MYYYVTLNDVQSYLDVTLTQNGVNTFNLLQTSMQDMADQYMNRTFNFTNPVIENFDAMNILGEQLMTQYTFFTKYPISTTVYNSLYPGAQGIISLTISNVPVDMNYVFSYKSAIRLSASFPSVLLSNPLGFKAVAVQYNSDDAQNVPSPVKQALIQWVGREILKSQDGGKETKEVMTGNIRVYFKEDKSDLPDFVKRVLDSYRLTPIDRF